MPLFLHIYSASSIKSFHKDNYCPISKTFFILRKIFYKLIQEGANRMSQEIELLNMGIHLCKEIRDLLEEREHRNLVFKQLVTKNDFSPLPLEYEKK